MSGALYITLPVTASAEIFGGLLIRKLADFLRAMHFFSWPRTPSPLYVKKTFKPVEMLVFIKNYRCVFFFFFFFFLIHYSCRRDIF